MLKKQRRSISQKIIVQNTNDRKKIVSRMKLMTSGLYLLFLLWFEANKTTQVYCIINFILYILPNSTFSVLRKISKHRVKHLKPWSLVIYELSKLDGKFAKFLVRVWNRDKKKMSSMFAPLRFGNCRVYNIKTNISILNTIIHNSLFCRRRAARLILMMILCYIVAWYLNSN